MNTHQRASRALRGCASLSTRRHHQVTTVAYDASLCNTIHPRRAVESAALPCAHTEAQLAVQPVQLWTAPTQDAPVDSKCNTDLWGATPPLDLPNLTLLPSPIRQVSRRLEAPPVGQNAAKPALHTQLMEREVGFALRQGTHHWLHARCILLSPRDLIAFRFGRRACWRSSPEVHIWSRRNCLRRAEASELVAYT
jgi:hypothetical protein